MTPDTHEINTPAPTGPYLALDLGEKRIGIALTDRMRIVARPFSVIQRTSRQADFAQIGQITAAHEVCHIIVGLPIMLNGDEGPMAEWARDYGQDLGRTLGLPVTFWDEALTSIAAEKALREGGLTHKKIKNKIDAVAAALLLQSYLEAEREQRGQEPDSI